MSGSPWFVRFFGGLYGTVLAGQFHQTRSARQARTIRRLLGLRKGQSVLDCPCGQGRITLALARLGLAVTGADLSDGFLRRARAAASKASLKVPFLRRDMRKIGLEGRFDAVVNWFTSFGYFGDSGNLTTAKAAYDALKSGGQFLVELPNKTWLVRHIHAGHDHVVSGVRIINRPRFDDRHSRLLDTWTMSRGRRKQSRQLSLRVYSGPELRDLLKQAGFSDVRLYGYSKAVVSRLSRYSPGLIAVGRKRLPSPRDVGSNKIRSS